MIKMRSLFSGLLLALAIGPATAFAQQAIPPDPNGPIPPADIPIQTIPEPLPALDIAPTDANGLPATAGAPAEALPFIDPTAVVAPKPIDLAPVTEPQLVLTARLVDDGKPIQSGLVWRIFGSTPGKDGKLPLVAEGQGGSSSFRIKSGIYFVHCSFGYAGTTDRVEVTTGLKQESVILNAGGVKFGAETAEGRPLISDDLVFDIYSLQTDDRGEQKLVARGVKPGDMLRLTADTYHVVSRYGDINAVTRADVEVKAGKLSQITLIQHAAKVTLKLVGAPGGEAIADTRWTVLTPGGDIVTEGVGAFPSFILAEGGYTVVAKHDDAVFQRDFDVESGQDGEVEVLADLANVPAQPAQ